VLAGLIGGSTTREIATSAGVSASTVNRTVKRLRDTARTLGYREAA
jgi:DNA-binding MurR/RpiR family transcriptional regulator